MTDCYVAGYGALLHDDPQSTKTGAREFAEWLDALLNSASWDKDVIPSCSILIRPLGARTAAIGHRGHQRPSDQLVHRERDARRTPALTPSRTRTSPA